MYICKKNCMRLLLLGLFFCIASFFTSAQTTALNCKLADEYVAQKTDKFGFYITVIDTLLARKYSNELLFTRMMVRHIYIAHLLFYDSKSPEISLHLRGFKHDIDTLETIDAYAKKVIPFKSAYAAYTAALRPAMAVYYLPRSFSLAKEALQLLPESPYSWAEYGNLEYCYALFISGNFASAIQAFSNAVNFFESQNLASSCNWYYLNTLLFLAKSYEDNKQFADANKIYDKILAIRPDYEAIHRWKHSL